MKKLDEKQKDFAMSVLVTAALIQYREYVKTGKRPDETPGPRETKKAYFSDRELRMYVDAIVIGLKKIEAL
jgi:hypothetical protein